DRHDATLTGALRMLACADETQPSPAVAARLAAEAAVLRQARASGVGQIAGLAIAATLALAVAAPLWRVWRGVPAPAEPGAEYEWTTRFLPLTYGTVPVAGGQIIRLEVSRDAFVSFGITPVSSTDPAASATVLADVLVGDDGLARAVRFVKRASRR